MCLAVPARIVTLLPFNMAEVDVNGNMVEVSMKLTPRVQVGDYVLIHAGFVLEIIDDVLARDTMSKLEELQENVR